MATPMESPQTHPVWCVLYGMGIVGFLVLYGIFQETMVRYRIYVAIWGSALGHWISWISWIWKTEGSKLNHAVLVLMHDDEWLMMRIWEFAEHDSEQWFIKFHEPFKTCQSINKSTANHRLFDIPHMFCGAPSGSRRESWQCPTMETWSWMMRRFWYYFNQWSMGFVNGICWDIAGIYMDLLRFTGYLWRLNGIEWNVNGIN
jgi:hypothetical protein